MTTSDSTPGDAPATKDELQRVVAERTAQAQAAETEPVVNPGPAKKRAPAKKAAAKKAPAKKAPAKAVAAATAADGDAEPAAAKKAAKRATKKAAPAGDGAPATRKRAPAKRTVADTIEEPTGEVVAEQGGSTTPPVVAPAPIAEPGSPSGAPAEPPAPPAPESPEPGTETTPAPEAVTGSAGEESAGGPVTGQAVPDDVGGEDLRAVVDGWSRDPHRVLGAHPAADGWVVRTLRPNAVSVAVLDHDDTRYDARRIHDGGVFEATLPHPPGDYRVEVTYPGADGGQDTFVVDDPYRWMPTLGELDQYLIGEGRHEQLWQVLGAHVRRYDTPRGTVEGVSFAVWAPNAQGVKVTGDFDYWEARAHPMRQLGATGVWEVFLPGVPVGTRYRYHVLGADGVWREKADPMAFATEVPPANASVVVESTHQWGDDAWLADRAAGNWHERPMSVYEVHLGSWRQGLSYRQLSEELVDYAVSAGFTHLEFLPVAEHPFGGSWGYQVTSYYAPTSRFGSPDDFRYLVDRAHQAGLGVIVDWVPAHFPKDEWALGRFDGTALYEHADPRRGEQPDWGTFVFNFGRTEVRNFLVANALFWCQEFHVDGLRVDAVASMLYLDYSREDGEWVPNEYGGRENLEAVSFLQEVNATVYREVPGVVTIAEESTAWPGVTRPTHLGGLGFGFKWNMGWMHDSLSYVQRQPVHRSYHHNQLTFSMMYAYSENYVLPISHDEVVYGKGSLLRKMPGDRWQQLANVRGYLAYMWAHPGKQLLFMGSEFAQDSEWAESRSLDWWHLDDPAHRGVLQLVTDLNARYRETEALWSLDVDPAGFQWIDANDASGNVITFLRFGRPKVVDVPTPTQSAESGAGDAPATDGGQTPGQALAVVCNFSGSPHHGYRIGLPRGGRWREVLNTDAEGYGGSGVGNYGGVDAVEEPWHGQPYSATLSAPPLGTVWLLHEG
ncbi:1,4-alpha-glucan branching protein GlgB [Geodermatophilus sp. URMC 62]|uniref:1,4-alpha-glucan branching protein GlgB n=1 Tax=Geodermatophilus sp. URMC 62 TaxID=3423414 RepID=UPI00406CECB8